MKHTNLLMMSALSSLLLFSGCDTSSEPSTTSAENKAGNTGTTSSTTNTTTSNTTSTQITNTQSVDILTQDNAKNVAFMIKVLKLTHEDSTVSASTAPQRKVREFVQVDCTNSGSVDSETKDGANDSVVITDIYTDCSYYSDARIQNGTRETINYPLANPADALEPGTIYHSKETYKDFSVVNEKLNYLANFSSDLQYTLSPTNTVARIDGSMTYTQNDTSNKGVIKYTNFEVKKDKEPNGGYQNTLFYTSFKGEYIASSSKYPCANGKYTFTTTTPLVSDYQHFNDTYNSGELIVNGATYSFDEETINVTTANGESFTVSQNSTPTCK